MPILIGGGVLLLVLAIGSYFVFRGGPEVTPSPSASPGGGTDAALLKQLLDSQALLARKHLEDKDFRAAVKQAKEVLDKDASHGDAAAVLASAEKALEQVDVAVAETRKAMDGGDVKAASEGLSRILALDPKNPAVGEFEPRLNQFFRSQAEAARKEMADSLRQADRTRQASSQPDYGAGSAVARDAEALFAKGEYAQATRKFMESRDAYERARRGAERAAKATPSVTPTTTMVAVATTQPPTTIAMVATPEPPTPPPSSGHADEGEIRELVSQYERALETRDPGLLKTLKPDLSGREQDALKRSAANDVNITVGTIQMQGGEKASVMCARTDRLSDGKTFNIQQTLILSKKGGRWTIQRIVSQQVGQ
jgi:tetratricopeptide (TPR) repeat protein